MRYVIRRIRMAHCKRGPGSCARCAAADVERACLLDLEPPDQGMVQRRVLQVVVDGVTSWREFDVVEVFPSDDAARRYAAEHGIESVEL